MKVHLFDQLEPNLSGMMYGWLSVKIHDLALIGQTTCPPDAILIEQIQHLYTTLTQNFA